MDDAGEGEDELPGIRVLPHVAAQHDSRRAPLNQTGRCAHLWLRDRSRGRKTSAREPSVQSLWLEYEPAGNGAVFNQAMALYGVLQGEATREDDLHISLHHQFKGALHLLQRGGK
jgi:hypothetical protein